MRGKPTVRLLKYVRGTYAWRPRCEEESERAHTWLQTATVINGTGPPFVGRRPFVSVICPRNGPTRSGLRPDYEASRAGVSASYLSSSFIRVGADICCVIAFIASTSRTCGPPGASTPRRARSKSTYIG
ncbi:hypothetical protein J6590_049586 [Homalodisca vitripennis]|nr:hypothetical protein J6590_049586 [Homalodisca vitripennis]